MVAEFYLFNNRSYIDFYPVQFGIESCDSLHSFGPARRQHYLFHYIISGKGILFDTEKQEQYDLSAGQGFLILPDMICSYQADQSDPWTYMWIEFDGLKTEHFLRQAGLNRHQLIFNQKNSAIQSPVYREMNLILQHYQDRSPAIIGHLYLFIEALVNESLTRRNSIHDDAKELYIRETINFIERHFQSAISIDDLAKHCNLNRYYFSRLFKEQMSISPQQFLIQYRLSQSCELLKNTRLTLREIAEEVGYSNQFNFSAAFKRQYGLSPNHWRKKYG